MRARIYITVLVLLAGSFTFLACNSSAKPKTSTEKQSNQKEVYSCEMHPEVISEKAGKCPKCGMELTKKMVPDTTKVTQ